MKQLLLFSLLLNIALSQSPLKTDDTQNIELLILQNTKLSENFYVNYTIGREATENIKVNFYVLPSVRRSMIGARNATSYNLNWAQQIHDEQKNMYFRGINPVGLLYVMATWTGLVKDPTTESAIKKSMKEFVNGID